MGSSSTTFLLFLLSLATLTPSQLKDVYFVHNCSETSGNYTANSPYETNLNTIISRFATLTDFNYGFFNLSAGERPDKVYSTALCRGDMNQADCNTCLNYTATELKQFCPRNKAATAWSQFCWCGTPTEIFTGSWRTILGLVHSTP
ncbi:cysteine-rich repeat secretory protein 38-like [Gossypium arboreum]|uniref:cysteine-rich repeat secretory protein 38-like n=1 Tax=Gossypium arboreum TaxID=29729 RepID=UPI0022F1D3CE|nr:cysteine-rich repeat secretory protein 38-like [Gossypium arboreum]